MTGPSTDIGRDLVVFVAPQTTSFKAAETGLPVPAEAVVSSQLPLTARAPLPCLRTSAAPAPPLA